MDNPKSALSAALDLMGQLCSDPELKEGRSSLQGFSTGAPRLLILEEEKTGWLTIPYYPTAGAFLA